MKSAKFISFWAGLCSLSIEIAWVRLYGYANQTTPRAFAYVLVVSLLGIAIGAGIGRRLCLRQSHEALKNSAFCMLLVAAILCAASPYLYYWAVQLLLDDLGTFLAIACCATALSVLFPITHHLGAQSAPGPNPKKGRRLADVYFFNIMGSALGPLITGYLLLEWFSIAQVFAMIAALLFCCAIALLAIKNYVLISGYTLGLSCIALIAMLLNMASVWHDGSKLARSFLIDSSGTIVTSLENRHGIISIVKRPYPGSKIDDFSVYGSNVYDGKTNLDIERDSNGLERPVLLHVLQPNAKRVLIIGISIGTWLTVLEGFPGVEYIDAVEINPGYLQAAQAFSAQAQALQDKRLHLHVDDARRWLNLHKGEKYDIILMNTSFHWRSNITMLLSAEFMNTIKNHLTPHGIMAYNATGSVDSFYTAAKVFDFSARYINFIYGAAWDFRTEARDRNNWERMRELKISGVDMFSENSRKIDSFYKIPLIDIDQAAHELKRAPELITDDNMLTEFRYGR